MSTTSNLVHAELVGPVGDGHKWLCGVDGLAAKQAAAAAGMRGKKPGSAAWREAAAAGCLAYSFGSSGDFRFEIDLYARTRCLIHVFDPSPQGRTLAGDGFGSMSPEQQQQSPPSSSLSSAEQAKNLFGGFYHEVGLGVPSSSGTNTSVYCGCRPC